ncbi:MAG: NGG1p interacting factor NIF3 [Candidatus Sericytochromatia bacterium]
MRIWQIYRQAVEMGMDSDPRGREAVLQRLAERQQTYDQEQHRNRDMEDKEHLFNPYPDTRLLWGNPEQEVKHVFVGIDIGPAELLLVDRLNQKGAGIDLVIAHHPEGLALTTLHQAMDLQTDIFSLCGVPVNVAEQILQGEADKTAFSIAVGNYNRSVDAARLLELPFMSVHTPTDNMVQRFWEERFAANPPQSVGAILEMLDAEPEYVEATKLNVGPCLLAGRETNRPGKIMVDMTGGTDAGSLLYKKLAHAGLGTLVVMHLSDGTLDVLREEHVNVVMAGHMSSDSLGMNLFLDSLEREGIQVTVGSGMTRYSRQAPTR